MSLVGTSVVVQWLTLHAPNAGGPGLIPGQRIRTHMSQLKRDPICHNKEDPECPNATTKTQHSQINQNTFKKQFFAVLQSDFWNTPQGWAPIVRGMDCEYKVGDFSPNLCFSGQGERLEVDSITSGR